MKTVRNYFLAISLVFGFVVQASEDHDHDHHDHHEEQEQDHHSQPANVGADKGITEFDEHRGFKLSAEAQKNFSLQFQKLEGKGPWSIPVEAILYSGEEVNVFRLRDGFYKRIDFNVVSKNKNLMQIKSDELRAGDEVVIHGIGFLRAAEIVVTDGAPEGHSH